MEEAGGISHSFTPGPSFQVSPSPTRFNNASNARIWIWILRGQFDGYLENGVGGTSAKCGLESG